MPTKSEVVQTGTALPRRFSRSQVAAIMLAIGLVFHGMAMLLNGDATQAMADFVGAMGTAGLPSVWVKGWTIRADDPAEDQVKAETAEWKEEREHWRRQDDTPPHHPKST